MFGFHKPKMYRSMDGCCICRAKSSSSRFTDSKRYETDFKSCFGWVEGLLVNTLTLYIVCIGFLWNSESLDLQVRLISYSTLMTVSCEPHSKVSSLVHTTQLSKALHDCAGHTTQLVVLSSLQKKKSSFKLIQLVTFVFDEGPITY